MCGIGGIINRKSFSAKADPKTVFRKYLANRGPDNFSTYESDNLLLAHARLKIIDLSDNANQPMLSISGHYSIVFNGEIYNYKEIAQQLNIKNEYKSDTRVIIEAIEEWGIEKTLSKLKGMFAFCAIDLINKKTYLARDRFGQKPLYYMACNTGEFIFSSDIRAITKLKKKDLTLNYQSIEYYLTELTMPQPNTIWNEVKQLEPAHYMVTDLEGNIEFIKHYWNLKEAVNTAKSEEITLLEIEEKLTTAILQRTLSDVPVACFLSGGVDSGLIVSMLASNSKDKIKTFTLGFNFEHEYNELNQAKLIAQKYNTDHTEVIIDINIKKDVEHILAEFGEPFADSSAIPSYYITQEMKKHASVALSGDGGDELFGGYIDYGYANDAENLANKIKRPAARQIVATYSKLMSRILKTVKNRGTEIDYLKIKDPYKLNRNMGFNPINNKYSILKTGATKKYYNTRWNQYHDKSFTTRLMKASLKTRLLNDYLVKVDRASMANSLEVRSPFMDHELAELAFSISNKLKFKNTESKYLLKKLGQKYMYQDIFEQKKKGFGIPIKEWLKADLYEFAKHHISNLVQRKNVVNRHALELLEEHKEGKAIHTHRIWALICLEIWFKNNL